MLSSVSPRTCDTGRTIANTDERAHRVVSRYNYRVKPLILTSREQSRTGLGGLVKSLRVGVAMVALLICSLGHADGLRFSVIDTPPFGMVGTSGPTGIYPSIVAAISAESRVPISVSLVPFARAAHEVAHGRADGTIMFGNAITEGKVVPVAPVFITAQVVQLAPGVKVQSIRDFEQLHIGRIRQGCQDLAANRALTLRFHELTSQRQGIDMLKAKRIQAFCSTPEALDWATARFDLAHALDPERRWIVSEKEVWLFVSTTVDPTLHQPLRSAVRKLQREGELARIFKDHLGPHYRLTLPAGMKTR